MLLITKLASFTDVSRQLKYRQRCTNKQAGA